MVQLRETMTLVQIGQKFGISGERVRQILKRKAGLVPDGSDSSPVS
jgi:DNA-directed RNA polymerase sigma subunit (sigma70/sigma32)